MTSSATSSPTPVALRTALRPADFRFAHRLRVRWAEVDMQKIVFNAHYLMYFDTAIADYWRALALPYEEAMRALDGDIVVRKATLDFLGSARLDDQLDVGLRCVRVGTTSMVFEGALFRGDQLLVSCELVYVFADPVAFKPRPVPQGLRDMLEGFESGQPMLQVQTGDWAELQAPASTLRRAVFVVEQNCPEDEEWDAFDAVAVHAVARNGLGQPVATARLLPATDGLARIGRVAVHRVLRGSGQGRAVMHALESAARARGDRQITLSAQLSAEAFYRRLGYARLGDTFYDAGIEHIEMRRAL